MSNAACLKHDSNVCACAVSALILLPVVNLSLHGFSDIDFLYDVETFTVRSCLSPNYGDDSSVRRRSFGLTTTSGYKSDVIFEFSAPVFL